MHKHQWGTSDIAHGPCFTPEKARCACSDIRSSADDFKAALDTCAAKQCRYELTFTDQLAIAVKHNSLDAIDWLSQDLYTVAFSSEQMRAASDVTKVLLCRAAAERGHVAMLQRLVQLELYEFSTPGAVFDLTLAAATFNHQDVLQWLLQRGHALHNTVTKYAVMNGHVALLRWLRTAGARYNSNILMTLSAHCKRLDMLKAIYADHENKAHYRTVMSDILRRIAGGQGDTATLAWVQHELRAPPIEDLVPLCLEDSWTVPALRWAFEQGGAQWRNASGHSCAHLKQRLSTEVFAYVHPFVCPSSLDTCRYGDEATDSQHLGGDTDQ